MIKFISFFIFLFSILNSHDVRKTFFGGLAIEGYDTVAYFTLSNPVKGKSEFEYIWKNAKWRFSTRENLEMFKANPEKYAPQYGGYCAYAMVEGEKYEISPEAWDISNGKLYLNYDKKVHKDWEINKSDFIKKADLAWKKLSSSK